MFNKELTMKTYQLVILFLTSFISSPLFAHAGHDHNSAMASLVHFLWIAPAVAAVAILYSKLVKNKKQAKSNNK